MPLDTISYALNNGVLEKTATGRPQPKDTKERDRLTVQAEALKAVKIVDADVKTYLDAVVLDYETKISAEEAKPEPTGVEVTPVTKLDIEIDALTQTIANLKAGKTDNQDDQADVDAAVVNHEAALAVLQEKP